MIESFAADTIYHAYGRKTVLRGIVVSARKGEILGIVGRNGSGKSTLFHSLAGLLPGDSGVFKINDEYIKKAQRSRHIAFLPQNGFLPGYMTVSKCVRFFCADPSHAAVILQDQRIQSLLRRKYMNLSGGEKRYLECMLILSLPKPLVLLDEPFSELEPISASKLILHIRELAEEKIIIISSHDIFHLEKCCSRFFLLQFGVLREIPLGKKRLQEIIVPSCAGMG